MHYSYGVRKHATYLNTKVSYAVTEHTQQTSREKSSNVELCSELKGAPHTMLQMPAAVSVLGTQGGKLAWP